MGHYWRPDDPYELTEALSGDWANILESVPRQAIERACEAYMAENRYRPTPADILNLAHKFIPRTPIHEITGKKPEEKFVRQPWTPERQAKHDELMARFRESVKPTKG